MKEIYMKDVRGKRGATGETAEHWTLSFMIQGGEVSPKSQALLCSTEVTGAE